VHSAVAFDVQSEMEFAIPMVKCIWDNHCVSSVCVWHHNIIH